MKSDTTTAQAASRVDDPVTYRAQGTSSPTSIVKVQGGSPRLRPLDILPVSATAAEIFVLESQLPAYMEALQKVVDASPPTLTEVTDFRRRETAYRNSYFRSYRLVTLSAFSLELRVVLLENVLNPTGPPPSKYKDSSPLPLSSRIGHC